MREQKSFYTAAAFHRHPACFWRTRSQPAVGQDSQDSMHFSHGFFWQPCEKLYFSQRQKFNYFRFSDLFEVRIGKKNNGWPFKYAANPNNSYGKHSTFGRLSLCSQVNWFRWQRAADMKDLSKKKRKLFGYIRIK